MKFLFGHNAGELLLVMWLLSTLLNYLMKLIYAHVVHAAQFEVNPYALISNLNRFVWFKNSTTNFFLCFSLDNFFSKMTDFETPRKNNDCYFYYYSTCTKVGLFDLFTFSPY